ncbi:hypothetical protein EDD86DRAFT_244091 [Gorgonomyces haynaldii]|nr:hypothetical protein EDD86DRAFT_244091 [Gorgonomyces haynaldii]
MEFIQWIEEDAERGISLLIDTLRETLLETNVLKHLLLELDRNAVLMLKHPLKMIDFVSDFLLDLSTEALQELDLQVISQTIQLISRFYELLGSSLLQIFEKTLLNVFSRLFLVLWLMKPLPLENLKQIVDLLQKTHSGELFLSNITAGMLCMSPRLLHSKDPKPLPSWNPDRKEYIGLSLGLDIIPRLSSKSQASLAPILFDLCVNLKKSITRQQSAIYLVGTPEQRLLLKQCETQLCVCALQCTSFEWTFFEWKTDSLLDYCRLETGLKLMNALVFTFYLPPLDPYLEFLFQVDPETYNKLWQEIQSLFKRLTSDPQYYWMVGRLLDYLTKHPKRHLMQLLNDTLPDITNCLSESRSVKRPLSAVREKPMVQQRGGKSADGQEMRQDKRRKLARFFAQGYNVDIRCTRVADVAVQTRFHVAEIFGSMQAVGGRGAACIEQDSGRRTFSKHQRSKC